jgi:hypothetical protein
MFSAVLFTVIKREMAPPLKNQDTWRTRAVGTWRLRLCKAHTLTRRQRVRLSQSPTRLTRTDSAHKAHTCRWLRLYLMRSWSHWNWSPKHSQAQAQTWECTRNKDITDNNIDTKFHFCAVIPWWTMEHRKHLDSRFLAYLTTPIKLMPCRVLL